MKTYLPCPPKDLLSHADSVLASLEQQSWLPSGLRLDIEEAVEAAWEIAYRKPKSRGVVVSLDTARAFAARSGHKT